MRFVKCFFPAIVGIVFSCGSKKQLPDISNSKVNIHINRLDKDLFAIDFEHVSDSLPFIKHKYGEFFDIYCYKVINIGNPQSKEFPQYLKGFLTDYNMNAVHVATDSAYSSLQWLETDLSKAFSYYQYYFPNKRIPWVSSYLSGFNQTMVTTDTILGVGIDKYLGPDCQFYKRLGLSTYIRANMTSRRLIVDCMRAWLMTEFEKNDSSNTLLSHITYQGKILYATQQLLPEVPDSTIMGYTQKQIKWCKSNEEKMWTYLVENKLLFNTQYMVINKFTGEAPFTKDFTNNSPGRAAVWQGWQIVCRYMYKNPEVTLGQLMANNNAQEILAKSKYRP